MYNIEVYDAGVDEVLDYVEGIPEDALASEVARLFREYGSKDTQLVTTRVD